MPTPPRRRWYQFSLRTMFVAVTLLSIPLGGIAWMLRFAWTTFDIATLGFWIPSTIIAGALIGSLTGRFWTGLIVGICACSFTILVWVAIMPKVH